MHVGLGCLGLAHLFYTTNHVKGQLVDMACHWLIRIIKRASILKLERDTTKDLTIKVARGWSDSRAHRQEWCILRECYWCIGHLHV